MCLIVLALDCHPNFKLLLAANRDEYLDRETAQAGFREDAPHVLAGKDLRGGGTWMGMTLDGRICALTNYRDPASLKKGAPSRGRLVERFLYGRETPRDFLKDVSREGGEYNGFNLIAGLGSDLYWFSNRSDEGIRRISPGVHGLSNRFLDTPWPKVSRSKEGLQGLLSEEIPSPDDLFSLMGDQAIAPDSELPRTGVPLEWERTLSPIFIQSPDYGTRSTTLLFIDREDKVTFRERTHDALFKGAPDVVFEFVMER